LRQEGFKEMVIENGNPFAWEESRIPMEIWQNKIKHLRSFLRGWAKNISSIYKKEKERLTYLMD
jgi:hypothetical protein